jgi:hypothetical protein
MTFFQIICYQIQQKVQETLFEKKPFLFSQKKVKLSFQDQGEPNTLYLSVQLPFMITPAFQTEPYTLSSINDPDTLLIYSPAHRLEIIFYLSKNLDLFNESLSQIEKLHQMVQKNKRIEPIFPSHLHPALQEKLKNEKAGLQLVRTAEQRKGLFFAFSYTGPYHNSELLRTEKRAQKRNLITSLKEKK